MLGGAVPGRLVLLACGFHLRPALIELGLRHDFLIEQRLDAGELAFGEGIRGLRVPHFRHLVDVEFGAALKTEPRFDLRGVGFGFFELRLGFRAGQPYQLGPFRDARAQLHRRRHDAPGSLGGDFGLLLGRQRSGRADKTCDRLIDRGDRIDGKFRGRCRSGLAGFRISRTARARGQAGGDKRAPHPRDKTTMHRDS